MIDLQTRMAEMGLVDPTDRQEEPERRAATPLETLDGMIDSIVRSKWVFSAPAAPEIIDELAECDFVVTAVGD